MAGEGEMEGRGEEEKRKGEGSGGREFVFCPRKKKEKSTPMDAVM